MTKNIFFVLPREEVISLIKDALLTSKFKVDSFENGTFKIGKSSIKISDFQVYISGEEEFVEECDNLIGSKLQIQTTTRLRRVSKCTGVNCTCGMCNNLLNNNPSNKQNF